VTDVSCGAGHTLAIVNDINQNKNGITISWGLNSEG